jgi:hypothetical protein
LEDNELVVDIVQKPVAIDSLMAKVAQDIWEGDWFNSDPHLFCCVV